VYKQFLCRPGQALRVSGGWGSQTSRQLAHECGKVVGPMNRLTLPPRDIPVYINEKFQWRHRESNPRLSGLYRSASTKCATGVNGVITLGEVRKIDHGYYLNFRGSQFTKGGGERIFSNQSFLYIPLSPPPPFQRFYLPLSNSVAKGKLFLGRKYFGGGGGRGNCPFPPPFPRGPQEKTHFRYKTGGN